MERVFAGFKVTILVITLIRATITQEHNEINACNFVLNCEDNDNFMRFRNAHRYEIEMFMTEKNNLTGVHDPISTALKNEIVDIAVMVGYNYPGLWSKTTNPETGEREYVLDKRCFDTFISQNIVLDNVQLSRMPLDGINFLKPKFISVNRTGINATQTQMLSNVPTLEHLEAENNQIESMPDFRAFNRLRVVKLSYNPIRISSYDEIHTNGKINILWLYNTNIDFETYAIKLLRTFNNSAFFNRHEPYSRMISMLANRQCMAKNNDLIDKKFIEWENSTFIPNIMSNFEFLKFRHRYYKNMKKNIECAITCVSSKISEVIDTTWITLNDIIDLMLIHYYNRYYLSYWITLNPKTKWECYIERDIEDVDFVVNGKYLLLDNIKMTKIPVDIMKILNVHTLYMMDTGVTDKDVQEILKKVGTLRSLLLEQNENIHEFPDISLSPDISHMSLENNTIDFSKIYKTQYSSRLYSLNLYGVEDAVNHIAKLSEISCSLRFSKAINVKVDSNENGTYQ